MAKFPFYKQYDSMDCGPTCLQMVAKFFGKYYSLELLREKCHITREGVSIVGISDAAEELGFRSLIATIPFESLKDHASLPVIVHWQQNHFIVVYDINKEVITIGDPRHGIVKIGFDEFKKHWVSTHANGQDVGLVLFLETSPDFYVDQNNNGPKRGKTFTYFLGYLKPYKKLIYQLYIGLFVSTILALILPFLSQSVIDIGVNRGNIQFIYLVLICQFVLSTAGLLIGFIRGWIFLHMGTRVSISIISDFIKKLLKLPFSFFDSKSLGDIMQRMSDHSRIQSFLTSSALNLVFAIIDFFIFGILLLIYNLKIFAIFFSLNILYFIWNTLFLSKRKALDYRSFNQMSSNSNNIVHLLQGINEIKLQNCEKKKRWEWEGIQAQQYQISIDSLKLGQVQQVGGFLIDNCKNLLISFFAAKSVIDGDMTLGMMLSISYITGQLNGPISQFIGLLYSYQDAKISLDRLREIHDKEDEESENEEIVELPDDRTITLQDVSFKYGGPRSKYVLKDINLTIPEGKKTAIVGMSGSGKSTLLKLLLKVYSPLDGTIFIGDQNLSDIQGRFWRGKCGIVSQEGYLFSDTIANNIAISDDRVNLDKLKESSRLSNVTEFVQKLPLKYNTKVGDDGNGLSHGQKQRLLLARAIYKDPEFIFLDESTNALDAENEAEILKNLDEKWRGKTIVVVAHRLSTVVHADQIIVMKDGQIIEKGTHAELIQQGKEYYNLTKAQLEL